MDIRCLREEFPLRPTLIIVLLALLPLSCVTPEEQAPQAPVLSLGEAARLLPAKVRDRDGWAADIIAAIEAVDKAPTAERVCAVIAVIEQESGYQIDPAVAHLPRIVRQGLQDKLAPLGPLSGPALKALLSGKAPGSTQSFAARIDRLRTERDLDRLYRDLSAAYRERLPGTFVIASAMSRLVGKGSFQDWNPVTTAGSMQVKVAFAKELDGFDDLSDAEVREKLYTRAGGLRAGTARLLAYEAGYDDLLYRFADYNAGMYASRNAAFQAQLARLSKTSLALDGDLLAYEPDGDKKAEETQSLKAMLAFGAGHDVSAWSIRRAVQKEKTRDFEDTDIWQAVRDAWQKSYGQAPVYAQVPTLTLASPKLSGTRTTAWFAQNVKRRYESCRNRQR